MKKAMKRPGCVFKDPEAFTTMNALLQHLKELSSKDNCRVALECALKLPASGNADRVDAVVECRRGLLCACRLQHGGRLTRTAGPSAMCADTTSTQKRTGPTGSASGPRAWRHSPRGHGGTASHIRHDEHMHTRETHAVVTHTHTWSGTSACTHSVRQTWNESVTSHHLGPEMNRCGAVR